MEAGINELVAVLQEGLRLIGAAVRAGINEITEQLVLLQKGLGLLLLSWSRLSLSGSDLWTFLQKNSQALNHLALIAAGVVGIPLLWIRTRAADRQASAAHDQARTGERGHITDRFTKAIEQFGSEKMAVRLGAIYALERISKDSPGDYWTIMEVLTAYVRDNAPWPLKEPPGNPFVQLQAIPEDGTTDLDEEPKEGDTQEEKIKPATDIQAILTVLGRRDERARKRDIRRLDLRGVDLRSADLREAHLERCILAAAHLQGATILEAHLDGADLPGADLGGANCWGAHLRGADLFKAHLKDADLRLADLRDADLHYVDFEDAMLTRAQLHGANLIGGRNLTQLQVDRTFGDERTSLPVGLTRPARWLKAEASPTTSPPAQPPQPEPPPDGPNRSGS